MNKTKSTKRADVLWEVGSQIAELSTEADKEGKEDIADYLMSLGQGYRFMAVDENVSVFGDRGKY